MTDSKPSPARVLAHKVLFRVERDGAYADRALDAELRRTRLDPLNRGLATEIVYGVLRHRGRLEFILRHFLDRPDQKLNPQTLVAILMGFYEVLELRTPDYAAVDDAVSLAGHRPTQRNLANALLRRATRAVAGEGQLPDPIALLSDPIEGWAVAKSHPQWLLRQVWDRLGEEAAKAWTEANNIPPTTFIRWNPLRTSEQESLELLADHSPETMGLPGCLKVQKLGKITDAPGFQEGLWSVQDLGAQLVVHLLAPCEGESILDSCSAPGGKTAQIAEVMGDKGKVIALEKHIGRTRLIKSTIERLGIESISVFGTDAVDPQKVSNALTQVKLTSVDGALVDAPCSGMGTLSRTPELRAKNEKNVTGLVELQKNLLDTAAEVVSPGGRLVYSVCTVTEREGWAQAEAFLKRHTDWQIEAPPASLAQWTDPDRPVLQTWPHLHGCDGFFAVMFRRP